MRSWCAIVINIIGSFVLLCWLIFGNLVMPKKGRVILWIVAAKSWIYKD